jgi:hypothetical protein
MISSKMEEAQAIAQSLIIVMMEKGIMVFIESHLIKRNRIIMKLSSKDIQL